MASSMLPMSRARLSSPSADPSPSSSLIGSYQPINQNKQKIKNNQPIKTTNLSKQPTYQNNQPIKTTNQSKQPTNQNNQPIKTTIIATNQSIKNTRKNNTVPCYTNVRYRRVPKLWQKKISSHFAPYISVSPGT